MKRLTGNQSDYLQRVHLETQYLNWEIYALVGNWYSFHLALQKKYDCTIEWEVWNSNVGQPGVCPANQFGQGKKEHHNQLAAKVPDSPFLHLGASVLTNAGGLVLWSVRTADCYRRFDAADTEPKRNHFNGHQQKSGREKKKRLIILPFTVLDFLPWVAVDDRLFLCNRWWSLQWTLKL